MPLSAQFKSMNELVDYLNKLEVRLMEMESEMADLRANVQFSDKRATDVISFVKDNWPKTSLVSRSWWVRAISVYGYFFVVNLIISAVLGLFSLIVLGPMIANAVRQIGPAGLQ